MKFGMPIACIGILLGVTAMPAQADISALYVTQMDEERGPVVDFGMTVEVNEAGDARVHVVGRSGYFLIRGGEVYSISRGIDGPYAERLDDLEAVIDNAAQAGGISLDLLEELPEFQPLKTGVVKVGKWKGQGYAKREFDGEVGHTELVLSDDESLRPIGNTIARLIDGRFGMLRAITLTNLFGVLGLYDPEVRKLFGEGTPIRVNMLELSEVSLAPIDPARFELPARVLSRDDISAINRPFKWAPAFDRQPEW